MWSTTKEESRWLLKIVIVISMFKNVLGWTRVALGAYYKEVFKMVCEFETTTVGIAVSTKWEKKKVEGVKH